MMSHRLLVMLLLCTFLCSCSSTRFMYNRLDFILPWYVEDYADLSDEQEIFLEERLSPVLRWHREQELPRYVEILKQMEQQLNKKLTPDDIEGIYFEFERAWIRTEAELLDWLLELGAELNEEQIEELLVEFDERQLDFEEEYLPRSDKEFRRDSYDSMLDTSTDYLGRLDSDQRDMLRAASEALLRSDALWLAERAKFTQFVREQLEREPGWEQRIRDRVALRNDAVSEEYLKVFEHNSQVLRQLTADVLNSRSDKQDRHLRERLQELIEDFEALTAESKANADAA